MIVGLDLGVFADALEFVVDERRLILEKTWEHLELSAAAMAEAVVGRWPDSAVPRSTFCKPGSPVARWPEPRPSVVHEVARYAADHCRRPVRSVLNR